MGTCCDAFESIESSFHPCEFTAIVPGAYPLQGGQNVQKLTHVRLAIAVLLVLINNKHVGLKARVGHSFDLLLRYVRNTFGFALQFNSLKDGSHGNHGNGYTEPY